VGDEHPAYAPAGAWLPLPLPFFKSGARTGQADRQTDEQDAQCGLQDFRIMNIVDLYTAHEKRVECNGITKFKAT